MAEREGSFHPKGHWHWRGSWLWMPFTIEHNNIPASGASRAWEMVVVKFAYQKVSWGCERSPLPLPVCPGGVLCSQLRVGPEPCWADLESLLPLQSVLHLVLSCCSGCDGHGQLPCLLSASSDNLYKGKTHQISPYLQMPSLVGQNDLEQTMSGDDAALLAEEDEQHLHLDSWVFPASLGAHFTLYCCTALAGAQLHCLLCGVSHCHNDIWSAEGGHGAQSPQGRHYNHDHIGVDAVERWSLKCTS